MNIIGVQSAPRWEDAEGSCAAVSALLGSEEMPAKSLVLLPEMFATGFSVKSPDLPESEADSTTTQFLQSLSDRYDSCVIGGVAIASDGRSENRAVVARPQREAAHYAKAQLFRPAGEDEHFHAGSEVALFEWEGWKIGLSICYDLRFPEIYRSLAAAGAEILVCIASWPAVRAEHWRALLIARAIENQAYVVGINRAGSDPNFDYAGGSIIVSPLGEVLSEAGGEEQILSAVLDRPQLVKWREDFPALRDLRTQLLPTKSLG